MSHTPLTSRRHALALAVATLGVTGAIALAACRSGDGSDALVAPVPTYSAGDTYAVTSTGRLISFNRAAPTLVRTSVQTGVGGGTIVGGDLRPSTRTLYVLSRASDGTGTLTVVDATTGAVVGTPLTLKAATAASGTTDAYTALTGSRFEVDFNPVVDRLRVISDTGQNLRVNPADGIVTTDGAINGGTGATTTPQVVADAYTNSLADACGTQLLVLTADGRLNVQNPPNNGTVGGTKAGAGIGTVAATDRVTFDIRTSLARADEGVVVKNTAVYGLDVGTGTATARGTLPLAAGEVVTALFATSALGGATETGTAAAQQGAMLAILGANVVTFNAATPQKLCSTAALGGLNGTGTETVLGSDFRPADGQVYVLTTAGASATASSGRIYTLNPYTGAATFKVALTGAPNLAPSDTFGVDFNPMADRLRVVSSGGQNLRLNVDTGATTTDTAINGGTGTRSITAVAYTNSAPLADNGVTYVATGATALYDIDTGDSNLYQQTNPNAGTLTLVGPLGVAGAALNGFDIVSAHTDPTTSTAATSAQSNTAYAALTVGGVANLYTVNIASGAATLVNRISDGTSTVRGLTRAK